MKCSIALIALGIANAYELSAMEAPSAPEDNSLRYTPAIAIDDKEFLHAVLLDPVAQSVADTLSSSERGHLDEAFQLITKLGTRAAREAANVAQQNWPIRKNVLNFLRDEAHHIAHDWCRPVNSWFCTRKFLDEALTFIDTKFCSIYNKEMRDETCLPEARFDYNRARLSRMPPY
eukprot:Gregarina_sp_Poly_1__416@NODE_10_length_23460_cov_121_463087_g8_i1_p15_GENE_NODE_10_length_23460_cov_121_463087_g8_i1NODE_10_length_23460_cov_121_463087_g8_i1_p15_ORF_typecomplete_len175_score27_33SPG48/PF14764_6/0_016_NODE_10_length_23460_cov_121_463087_g8_i140404564